MSLVENQTHWPCDFSAGLCEAALFKPVGSFGGTRLRSHFTSFTLLSPWVHWEPDSAEGHFHD